MSLEKGLDSQYVQCIQTLRSMFAASSETGDNSTRMKCGYGLSLLERAAEALENRDEGSLWLNLSGAMGFGKMAGLPATEVDRIRAEVDVLFAQ